MQIELISRSPGQTRRIAQALARRLTGGDVVALVGPLGAGKTEWVKGLAEGLGIDPDRVHSPTFTLINEYAAEPAGSLALYHVDVYRLSGEVDLEALGFDELLAQRDGVTAVEWADRVRPMIPSGAVWVEGSMPSRLGPTERRYRIVTARADLLESLKGVRLE